MSRSATPAQPDLGRRLARIGAVAAVVVALDQLTKWWAVRTLSDRDVDLFWTLRLHLVRNTGAAFSVGAGRGGVIPLVAIAVVVGIVWWGRAMATGPTAVALGFVLGGALGNLVDRVVRDGSGFLGGGVIDFVDLQWWPVFNLADAAITVGGLALVALTARQPEPRPLERR